MMTTENDVTKTEAAENEVKENKKKIILAAAVMALVLIAAILLFWLSDLPEIESRLKVILIVAGLIEIFGGAAIASVLDKDAGAFECPECHQRFAPDMKAYVRGVHTVTSRKLVCPHCGAHRFCKKVLTK